MGKLVIEYILSLLSSQSSTSFLTVVVILSYFKLRQIQKAARTANHNTTVIVKALLKVGILSEDEIKDVNLT